MEPKSSNIEITPEDVWISADSFTLQTTGVKTATQSRWRSKVLWASIAAQVLALLQLTGALDAMGIDAGMVGNVIAAVLGILSTVGIFNDPTNKEGW